MYDYLMANLFWGDYHFIFIYFPSLLFSLTLVCDLFYGIGKQKALHIGLLMLIGATLFCVPAVLTGLSAAKYYSATATDSSFYMHKWLGFVTLAAGVCYSLFRLGVIYKKWTFSPLLYVGLSLILVSLNYWTTFYGEKLH